MDETPPEWDNQTDLCLACMTKRSKEGKCKCPPPPSLEELLNLTKATNQEDED